MRPAPRGHNESQEIVRNRSLSQELLGRLLLIVACCCLAVGVAVCSFFGLLVVGIAGCTLLFTVWDVLGGMLGISLVILGLCWSILGFVGPSWWYVGAMLAHLGASWGQVGAKLEPNWSQIGAKMAQVGSQVGPS